MVAQCTQQEEVDEIFDKITKEGWGDYFKEQHDIDISKFKISMKDSARYSVQMNMRMYPLLMDLHYKLLINQTNVEFIASDNPVVFYNQLFSFRPVGSSCGTASKGLQIFLPLDQENCWSFTTPTYIALEATISPYALRSHRTSMN